MLPGPNVPDISPSKVSMIRRPLPSPRSLVVRFPWLLGTPSRSDFLPPFSSGLFCFPSDTAPRSLLRSHAGANATRHGPGDCSPGFPHPDSPSGNGRTSQVPEGPRCLHAMLSDPGGSLVQCRSYQPVAFRLWNSVGSRLVLFRGSIIRPADSLCTLRRVSYLTTTQHLVPAADTLGRAGLVTCRVPTKGFQNRRFLPPFSGFAWRTPN
jgi:hypothetical protein